MNCPKCGKEIEQTRSVCPSCGVVVAASNNDKNPLDCWRCHIARVPIQKKKTSASATTLGTIILLIGLFSLTFNSIIGLLIIIVAFIVGMNKKEYTVMVCPQCGDEGRHL